MERWGGVKARSGRGGGRREPNLVLRMRRYAFVCSIFMNIRPAGLWGRAGRCFHLEERASDMALFNGASLFYKNRQICLESALPLSREIAMANFLRVAALPLANAKKKGRPTAVLQREARGLRLMKIFIATGAEKSPYAALRFRFGIRTHG